MHAYVKLPELAWQGTWTQGKKEAEWKGDREHEAGEASDTRGINKLAYGFWEKGLGRVNDERLFSQANKKHCIQPE